MECACVYENGGFTKFCSKHERAFRQIEGVKRRLLPPDDDLFDILKGGILYNQEGRPMLRIMNISCERTFTYAGFQNERYRIDAVRARF